MSSGNGLERRLLHALLETSADAIFLKDVQGRYMVANRAAARFLGRTVEEVIGRTDAELFTGGTGSAVMRLDAAVLAGGKRQTFEEVAEAAGVVRTFLSDKAPLRDESGGILGLVGICRDVSEYKQAVEDLRLSEERYRSLVTTAAQIVWITDPQGSVPAAVPAWLEYTGQSGDEMLGDGWSQALHPEDSERVLRLWKNAVASRSPYEVETRLRRHDGVYRYFLARGAPVFNADGSVREWVGTCTDIDDRKQAEKSLAERETMLRTVFDAEPQCVLVLGPECTVLRINPAGLAMMEATLEDLQGWPICGHVVVAHDRDNFRAVHGAAFLGKSGQVEFDIQGLRGTRRHLQSTVVPLRNARGEIFAVLSIARDVTERDRAQEELRRSEARFRALAETSTSATFVYQGDTFAYVNPAGEQLTGYSAAELSGMRFWELVHPDYRETVRERGLARQRGEDLPSRYEVKIVAESGEERWLDFSAGFIEWEGKPAGLGTAFDITDHKRAEQALRASEQRYRDLFQNANDIVFTLDGDGRFTSLNGAGERVSGYRARDVLGKSAFDIVLPQYGPELRRRLADTNGRGEKDYEVEILTAAGKHARLEVSTRRMHDIHAGVEVQGIARDVTERRRGEEQARIAQRLEAVGRLAGGVAHDFNNMLGIIMGYSDILAEKLKDTQVTEYLQHIRTAAGKAAGLTRQLLAFSRQQPLQPSLLDLNSVVTEMGKLLQRVIGEDLQLVTKLAPRLAPIRADRTQLEQVVLNLAVNARDAMPKGGRLLLETANVRVDQEFVALHQPMKPDDYVLLTVSDTGCGMDAQTQSHIFEPFYTTKPGKGTGLGLSTVYGIVKQSNGFIWVDSEVGVGTTFKIYMPVAHEPQGKTAPVAATAASRGGTETVLLVEDEPALLALLTESLQQAGYTVMAAENGKEALAVADSWPGSIDLVVTDMIMPEMRGSDLEAHFLARRPGTRFLFISGYSEEFVNGSDFMPEEMQLLPKPFTLPAFMSRVRQVLEPAP